MGQCPPSLSPQNRTPERTSASWRPFSLVDPQRCGNEIKKSGSLWPPGDFPCKPRRTSREFAGESCSFCLLSESACSQGSSGPLCLCCWLSPFLQKCKGLPGLSPLRVEIEARSGPPPTRSLFLGSPRMCQAQIWVGVFPGHVRRGLLLPHVARERRRGPDSARVPRCPMHLLRSVGRGPRVRPAVPHTPRRGSSRQ